MQTYQSTVTKNNSMERITLIPKSSEGVVDLTSRKELRMVNNIRLRKKILKDEMIQTNFDEYPLHDPMLLSMHS